MTRRSLLKTLALAPFAGHAIIKAVANPVPMPRTQLIAVFGPTDTADFSFTLADKMTSETNYINWHGFSSPEAVEYYGLREKIAEIAREGKQRVFHFVTNPEGVSPYTNIRLGWSFYDAVFVVNKLDVIRFSDQSEANAYTGWTLKDRYGNYPKHWMVVADHSRKLLDLVCSNSTDTFSPAFGSGLAA